MHEGICRADGDARSASGPERLRAPHPRPIAPSGKPPPRPSLDRAQLLALATPAERCAHTVLLTSLEPSVVAELMRTIDARECLTDAALVRNVRVGGREQLRFGIAAVRGDEYSVPLPVAQLADRGSAGFRRAFAEARTFVHVDGARPQRRDGLRALVGELSAERPVLVVRSRIAGDDESARSLGNQVSTLAPYGTTVYLAGAPSRRVVKVPLVGGAASGPVAFPSARVQAAEVRMAPDTPPEDAVRALHPPSRE